MTTLKFGQTKTWADGTSISVSAPVAFTATEAAQIAAQANGAVAGDPEIVFTIVEKNGTKSDLMPYVEISIPHASGIQDWYNPIGSIGDPPATAIKPGQFVSWMEGFSVTDASDISIKIGPGYGATPVIFSSK